MFKKNMLKVALATCALAICTLCYFCVVRAQDLMAYAVRVAEQEGLSGKTASAYQTREGVAKDIWISDSPGIRLHHRIASKGSLLSLVPRESKVDVIENLRDMQCWMQDKIYQEAGSPMQQVRFFEADEGTYCYNREELEAQSVSLFLFRVPHTQLPAQLSKESAFLKGVADDVVFSLANNTPKFHAEKFKADFTK